MLEALLLTSRLSGLWNYPTPGMREETLWRIRADYRIGVEPLPRGG